MLDCICLFAETVFVGLFGLFWFVDWFVLVRVGVCWFVLLFRSCWFLFNCIFFCFTCFAVFDFHCC